jgi:hypothetical protein
MYEEERRERTEVRASAFNTMITSSGFACSIQLREYLNQRIWACKCKRHGIALRPRDILCVIMYTFHAHA